MSEPRELSSPRVVMEILRERGIRPKRSMGQNFLIDANVVSLIARAARLSPSDEVIEVGAGLGALTGVLAERCHRVFALEADSRIMEVLERELGYAGNLMLVHADAAGFDFASLWNGKPPPGVKMVSNLPYGIAASLVVDCLKRYSWISEYTVMVQREVAERMTASPGRKDYSAASVKIQQRATVRLIARVSRKCFYPVPGVDSEIVGIKRKDTGEAAGDFFDSVVSAAFAQRRKKLANSLSSSGLPVTRDAAERALAALGKGPWVRAETLTPDEFWKLSLLLG